MQIKRLKVSRNIIIAVMVMILVSFNNISGIADTKDKVPSNIKKYIGQTYWSKTYYFGFGYEPYVFELSTNKKIMLDKNQFFTKLKVIGYSANGASNNFIALINGKKCLVDETVILNADPKDYSIFTKDPKTMFKWSPSIWKKLCTLKPFLGMTPDMLKMIRGNYTKLNKVKSKNEILDQWVYLSDVGNEFYYFRDGKLVIITG